MKTGLVAALAAAILLLGSLIYWKTRPAEGAEPSIRAQASPADASSPSVLSEEAPGPERNAAAQPNPGIARAAAAPATIPPPALQEDLASPSDMPVDEVNPVAPASVDEARPGSAAFEKRYEGTSAEQRRAAQESLRVLLYSNQEGEPGKGQALTDEQIQDFKREIEWLTEHEIP